MAIDPPYRLDLLQNIINIRWGPPEITTGFDGEHTGTSVAYVYGDLFSSGRLSDGNYYVAASVDAPEPGQWRFDGQVTKEWPAVILTHNEGPDVVYAKVLDNSGGSSFFGGNWYDDGGQNPPYGGWGIELGDLIATEVSSGHTMRVHHIDSVEVREYPYQAWLRCYVHWSS